MKKMMTNMKTLVALLMAGAAVTSCSSDSEMDSLKAPAGKTYTMTVQATKGGDAMTRALADGGTTLTSTWSKDDVVEVWSEDGTTTKYGELTAATAGASTTLTGTLTTLPENGATLTLKYLSANYSTQDGTLTGTDNSIDKKCDYATATVEATVSGDKVTTAAATFQHQQAVVKFTLKNKTGDSDLSATKFTVIADGNTYTVTPASAASVLYVAVPAISAKQVTLTAKVGDTYYDFGKTSATFENGKFYRVTVKMTNGTLSGKFTINSSGDKVYFSKGNLQYQASTSTWRFAEHQYDYVGDATNGNVKVGETKSNNASISSDYSGWIDLFGWGTSGQTFASGYGTAYQPYATSSTNTDYGPSGNYNLTDTYANGDWGVNMGTGWRTLTSAEWTYVFNTRTVNNGTGSGKSYTLGQSVEGKLGVVLYPDDYTGAEYSGSDWATFESAGCVFLPAAGFRGGTSVGNVGSDGDYWSSTADGTDRAYSLLFISSGVNPASNNYRSGGFSVRLVRPVQE